MTFHAQGHLELFLIYPIRVSSEDFTGLDIRSIFRIIPHHDRLFRFHIWVSTNKLAADCLCINLCEFHLNLFLGAMQTSKGNFISSHRKESSKAFDRLFWFKFSLEGGRCILWTHLNRLINSIYIFVTKTVIY